MNDSHIRYATIEDALQIATINIQSWQLAYRGIIEDEVLNQLSIEKCARAVQKRLGEQPKEIMLLENQSEIEGFIGFGMPRDEDLAHPQIAEIYTVYFKQNYYGNGNADKLMRFVLKLLQDQQKKEVVLWVFEENKRARHFYEKIGFKTVTSRKLYKEKIPEIRLSLHLG